MTENQLVIVVVGKFHKNTFVLDILGNSYIRKKEHENLNTKGRQRKTRKDVEGEKSSAVSINLSTWSCDFKAGRVAPGEPGSNKRYVSVQMSAGLGTAQILHGPRSLWAHREWLLLLVNMAFSVKKNAQCSHLL